MPLRSIIPHQIQREAPDVTSALLIRDSCWQQNGRIEECFRELKFCMMRRLSKEYGRFSDDLGSHPFASWLGQYLGEKLSFESMTKKTMEHFKIELDKTDVLTNGFIVFAHEELEHENTLHIFFVQHNTGQFIDGELDISESLYLDTSNVSLAAKINIGDWQSGDAHRASSAVTLLRWRGEKELTDVFVNTIGFAEKVDIAADTDEFLSVVSDYTDELPEETAFQTKKKVIDYCLEQEKIGKPVAIESLSQELKENPPIVPESIGDESSEPSTSEKISLPEFADFVAEKKSTIKPELIPDKSRLRQFVRISGRDNNISMSFTSSCLGDTIVYDPATDSLTINNIPASLKTRLAKHLQGKD
jgi:nucleoid-associated protein